MVNKWEGVIKKGGGRIQIKPLTAVSIRYDNHCREFPEVTSALAVWFLFCGRCRDPPLARARSLRVVTSCPAMLILPQSEVNCKNLDEGNAEEINRILLLLLLVVF